MEQKEGFSRFGRGHFGDYRIVQRRLRILGCHRTCPTAIGEEAFAKMTFRKAILPEKLQYIGNDAFFDCKQLSVVNLPESLKELRFRCLARTAIRQIKIPSKCVVIPSCCFEDCKFLQTVILPEKLEEIEWNAFENSGVESIIIPASVKKIERDAFDCHDHNNKRNIHIAVLGKCTEFESMPYRIFGEVTIYCLASSTVQNQARLNGIQVKPLSEFKNI